MQGEMALYGLLGLTGGEFAIQPYAEPARRTISGSHEFLLMEAARIRDESSSQARVPGSMGIPSGLQAALDSSTRTEARGISRRARTLIPASAHEPHSRSTDRWPCCAGLSLWGPSRCEDIENRLEVFKKLEQQAMQAARGTPSGRFHRVSMDLGNSRVLIQIQPTYKLLVRSALPATSNTNNGAPHE